MKLSVVVFLTPMILLAGPVLKKNFVAEGYPDWQGITAKSYIAGREICPSDLRHKVTVVLEIEPNDKLQEQLVLAAPFARKIGLPTGGDGSNWETLELPRDVIFVISNRGGGKDKDHDAINAAMRYKGEDLNITSALSLYRGMACSTYDDITFTGAPDSTGKRPFVYVMGPAGTEPLCQGELNATIMKTATIAIAKGKKLIEEQGRKWRPFYGNIDEPKFFPMLVKALEKGKPLAPIEKMILKDVVAKDPEKSNEAQVLYDALCQTRSDLVMRIKMEVTDCPHRAYYDIQQLVKYWPMEKKHLDAVYEKLKAVPEVDKMARMFMKIKTWSEPEFACKNAGEAKKIVAELNKMKKELEKLKESKVVVVQNGALIMDIKVDELIMCIPSMLNSK